jgi:hypothetical protein
VHFQSHTAKIYIFEIGIAEMAEFCQMCVEGQLNFADEVYKLFAHPSCAEGSKRMHNQHDEDEVYAVLLYDIIVLSKMCVPYSINIVARNMAECPKWSTNHCRPHALGRNHNLMPVLPIQISRSW